jgi:N-methylhydantoinase B/oxoprolinase/acetone carboxylase alpha subunit
VERRRTHERHHLSKDITRTQLSLALLTFPTPPSQVNILANRRVVPPYGMQGGEPGQCGRSAVRRAGCEDVHVLHSCDRVELQPGDVFILQTPSGGGFGPPEPQGPSPDDAGNE